jgi:dTDP-4-amino-4,6-dideoxygalactose transaminase
MTTRREMLRSTAGALAGLAFVGCDLMGALPARAQARRREVAAVYRRGLAGSSSLRLPLPSADCRGNGWINVIFHDRPEALRSFLWRRHRVDTARPSLDPCHELLGACAAAPTASRLLSTAVYLPSSPSLASADISRLVLGLRTFTDDTLGDPAWI